MPVSSVRRVNCPCPTSPPSGAVILEKFFAAAVHTAAVVVPSGGGKYRRGVLRPSWTMANGDFSENLATVRGL